MKLPFRPFAAVLLGAALAWMPPAPARAEAPVALAEAAIPPPPAPPADPALVAQKRAEQALLRLFADDAQREQQVDPLEALYHGEAVAPEAFALLFTDVLKRRQLASAQASLRMLQRIDRGALSPERQISRDVFAQAKQAELAWLAPDVRALEDVRPFNHFNGLHMEFASLLASDGAITFATEDDYRRALAYHAAFPTVIDNAVARFRQGLANGTVESRLTVVNMIAQIDGLLAQPVEQSPFYSPILAFPHSLDDPARARLRRDFSGSISGRIIPAYRRLRTFLTEEYLPAAREQPGLSAMKGGSWLYRRLIERQTTLRLDPEEIHRLGLSEVARIQTEMKAVQARLGDSGPLGEFFDRMRTDPRFHPRTRDELAQGFARYARLVDAQIPRFFAVTPRTPLVIEPYPAYREKYEAGGSYSQGSADGSRPGTFYFNTYDLPGRFLTGMATLYLHEGAPGHHFQISLALENTSLPAFQRFDGNAAYVEGWALYAETLGFEMGLYDDPMQHWGTLDDEMLRAMRLVVDTGLHAKGWSREQAIAYMLANSGMGRTDATSEVDRYIANPAQALSYKIGALTIQRLRRKAEADLGPAFDIRQFHAQVLGSGALPLPILEAKIERWIQRTRFGAQP